METCAVLLLQLAEHLSWHLSSSATTDFITRGKNMLLYLWLCECVCVHDCECACVCVCAMLEDC